MALVKADFPHLSDFQAITLILLWRNYRALPSAERAAQLAKSGVPWPWPFHTKSEPFKTIRLKTDLDDMGWDTAVVGVDEEHAAAVPGNARGNLSITDQDTFSTI